MNARLILTTTAVASSKACRVFRVKAAIMDEGSQVREVESIGAIEFSLPKTSVQFGNNNSECCTPPPMREGLLAMHSRLVREVRG